jgi:hypothetical protein
MSTLISRLASLSQGIALPPQGSTFGADAREDSLVLLARETPITSTRV